LLVNYLGEYDQKIRQITPFYGPNRQGDIPHSLASIEKIKLVLGYEPKYDAKEGFKLACEWYCNNLLNLDLEIK